MAKPERWVAKCRGMDEGAPFVFVFVRDGGKCERFAFHFESKFLLSKFIKLRLFVLVREGENVSVSHFASYRKKLSETVKLAHPRMDGII